MHVVARIDGITTIWYLYRIVGRGGDDAGGGAVAAVAAVGEGVERGLEELRGAGADDDVAAVVRHCVADEAVEAADLGGEFGLQEPAQGGGVGEVAHRPPPRDHDRRLLPRLLPERLEHRRIAAARITTQSFSGEFLISYTHTHNIRIRVRVRVRIHTHVQHIHAQQK